MSATPANSECPSAGEGSPEVAVREPSVPTSHAIAATNVLAAPDALLREYQELCNNMRHYGTARLTRLVMFLALTGGLLTLFSDSAKHPFSNMPLILSSTGAALAILFWVVDIDVVFNFRTFRDRAIEIESALHLEQYSLRRARKQSWLRRLLNETNSTYLLYGLAIVLWFVLSLQRW